MSGGVKRYVHEKVAYLRRERTDCEHILIIPGEKNDCVIEAQRRIYTIKSPLISRTSRYRMLLNLGAIENIIERERPNIIESGDPYQVAWKAIATGKALRIPVVAFYHSHFPEAYLRSVEKYLGHTAGDALMEAAERYVRHLYNHFAYTLVPSTGLQQLLVKWGIANTVLAELGVDTNIFKPGMRQSGFRKKYSIGDHTKLLLYIGRLAPEKNVKTLFRAFEIISRLEPGSYHLMVLGEGTTRDSLIRLSESTSAVTWLPDCDNSEELARIYREADLFVHPGVQETFGLVTLESQACGTPVIGIRGSYMDRIIYSNQRHWAAENTPESLAAAILQTCQGNLSEIGEEVSVKVRTNYDWDRVFTKLLTIYQSCIA